MNSKKPDSRSRIKDKLASLLTAGAGSVVLATAVMTAPAEAAQPPSSQPVLQRADEVRARLGTADPDQQPADKSPAQLAWWRNWGNGGWAPHPSWHNWPNWRNWHNWRNY